MKHQVTIIVPVYNVEDYLPRCIESILTQSHKNLELILVNDGSTDSSASICDRYAQQDKRIAVLHKKNSGSSDSRNLGIDNAKGEYLLFVDSDDYLHQNSLKLLIGAADSDNNIDVVSCGFMPTSGTDNIATDSAEGSGEIRILTAEQGLQNMMYQQHITNSPWAKLYRSHIFENVRYPSGKINQDLGTTYKVLAKSRSIAVLDKRLYYYAYRPDSVINSAFKPSRMAGLEFAYEQLNFMKNYHPSIIDASTNRLFMESVFILQKMTFADTKSYPHEYQQVSYANKSTRRTVLCDANSKLRYRVFALFSFLSPLAIVLIGRLIVWRQWLLLRLAKEDNK